MRDLNRECWVLLDAPVFGADFRDVAPIIIRRTEGAGYEVRMGGLPDESDFKLIPTPDVATWVGVKVVSFPGPGGMGHRPVRGWPGQRVEAVR